MESAESQFSKISAQYDAQRKFMIPHFDDFYAAASDFTLPPSARVIDLGAGTGILSARVLEKNPTAQIELLDVSEKMLEQARLRFTGANVKYTLSDFASWNPQPRSFDAVISALAIHHIPDAEKIALYKKIFGALKDGGIFVNAEQVLGETDAEIAANAAAREEIILRHMSPEHAVVARERLKLDRCATVKSQLEWLSSIGFSDCECLYSHLDFAVLKARFLTFLKGRRLP